MVFRWRTRFRGQENFGTELTISPGCTLKRGLPQFLGGQFDYFAIAPYTNRHAFAGVPRDNLLNGCFERHLSALFERQFKNIGWRVNHVFPKRESKASYRSGPIILSSLCFSKPTIPGVAPELSNSFQETGNRLSGIMRFLSERPN